MEAKNLYGDEAPNPSAGVGSTQWGSRIRKKAKELAKQLETGYMELAEILYKVYDTPVNGDPKNPPIYTEWGFKTFAEYAESELGLQKRKAERLRSIWFHLEVQMKQLDPAIKKRIVALGWTKVRELVRVLSMRNAAQWVEVAEKSSYPELYDAIVRYEEEVEGLRQQMAVDGGDDFTVPDDALPLPKAEKLHHERFAFYDEQRDIVMQALQRAEELSGSKVKSNNLHLICMEFLATNDFYRDERSKAALFKRMEESLGVRMIVVQEDQIMYGVDALEKLAKGEA